MLDIDQDSHPILVILDEIQRERSEYISDGHDDAVAIADARAHYQFQRLLSEAPQEEEMLQMHRLIDAWRTNSREARTNQLGTIAKISKGINHILTRFWGALKSLHNACKDHSITLYLISIFVDLRGPYSLSDLDPSFLIN